MKDKKYRTVTCTECDGEGADWDSEFEEFEGNYLPPLCPCCQGHGKIVIDEDDKIVQKEMDKLG